MIDLNIKNELDKQAKKQHHCS